MEGEGMKLTRRFLSEAEKREICSWRYPGEYAIYNEPPYEKMKREQTGFFDPARKNNYRAYYDGDTLVGFTNVLEKEAEVFVGVGLAPALCGRGYGKRLLEDVCGISKELYPGKPLYLEVRTWNERAVRCYLGAGFQIDGEPFEKLTGAGPGTFYRMVRA